MRSHRSCSKQNRSGLFRVLPPGVQDTSLKISEGNTDIFTDESVGEAIVFAADNGAAIINLSLGWRDRRFASVRQLIASCLCGRQRSYAGGRGRKFTRPVWCSEANLEKGAVAVSAIDGNDRNEFSGLGPELDLLAPRRGRYA